MWAARTSHRLVKVDIYPGRASKGFAQQSVSPESWVVYVGAVVHTLCPTCAHPLSSPCASQVVTPDLKLGNGGALVHVDLAAGRRRLGGSALAQAYNQLGNSCREWHCSCMV